MDKYITRIKSLIPDFDEAYIGEPFDRARIDSMDLLTIRVEFENMTGGEFSDKDWLTFNSLADIISYCKANNSRGNGHELSLNSETAGRKRIKINMPQMAIGALSENWLFKEMGDTHWDLLCRGLNTESLQLKDEGGNRLYATFVRIRMQSTLSLDHYMENDELEMQSSIMRFGNGMYFSDISLGGLNGKINTSLMTSFSIRNETDNTRLVKSQPAPAANTIEEYTEGPLFGNEYRLVKKGVNKELLLEGERFVINDEALFTTSYDLNPYYDLNGVGLLYFAAYPIINNTCEARFFNKPDSGSRWEQDYHVIARDVFYFANCNINERIKYVLNGCEFIDKGRVKVSSSLYRESDGMLMARIFTIKKKQNEIG